MRNGRVTSSTRESAIEACALMASSNTHDYPLSPASLLADAIDVNTAGAELARAAINAVWPYRASYETVRELWAEAEQLLAHGWNPGDPVEALNIGESVKPVADAAKNEIDVDALIEHERNLVTAGCDPVFPSYAYGTPTLDDVD